MKLDLNNISKSFTDKNVINSISFTVQAGEFVSLLGPSGSGKSTLFSLIGGLLSPDEGVIKMNGEDITNKTGHISYMPQHESLLPWRTVLQNVVLGQELKGIKEKDRATAMLVKAGLSDVINAYPDELSGGMQQRVAFIRALLSPQSFMCLDEPFSALDDFTRLDMQKWLLEMWKEYQRSILFVTHNIDEALFLSDKIIILSDRPATIKDIIELPFTRPRDEELLLSDLFLETKKKVLRIIKNE